MVDISFPGQSVPARWWPTAQGRWLIAARVGLERGDY
jgi:hypothetical protein